MDRKRKWDEPAEAAGATAQSAEGDTPLKAVKTEEGASTRSASHEGGGGGGVDKAAEAAGQSLGRFPWDGEGDEDREWGLGSGDATTACALWRRGRLGGGDYTPLR